MKTCFITFIGEDIPVKVYYVYDKEALSVYIDGVFINLGKGLQILSLLSGDVIEGLKRQAIEFETEEVE